MHLPPLSPFLPPSENDCQDLSCMKPGQTKNSPVQPFPGGRIWSQSRENWWSLGRAQIAVSPGSWNLIVDDNIVEQWQQRWQQRWCYWPAEPPCVLGHHQLEQSAHKYDEGGFYHYDSNHYNDDYDYNDYDHDDDDEEEDDDDKKHGNLKQPARGPQPILNSHT